MFIPHRTHYTKPVRTPEQLLDNCRDTLGDNPPIFPKVHVVATKTCDEPGLLARNQLSLRLATDGWRHIAPVVVDDSKLAESRQQNMAVAEVFGSRYCAVLGRFSIVSAFGEYIDRTEPRKRAGPLNSYLSRIVTDFPKDPSKDTWGGVAGAQNVGHLVSAMLFGENRIGPADWLSTFLDDDLLMPPDGRDIFKMIEIYHRLGNVGIIVSNYLHHPGSLLGLANGVLSHLATKGSEMSDEAVAEEIINLTLRTPTVGLRNKNTSDGVYSRPEVTMTFPMGNYSLSDSRAFGIPVPILGIEDLGYGEMLRLFIGSKNLGVGRVPDFAHVRQFRPNGGNAYPTLDYFCRLPVKDIVHAEFQALLREYGINDESVPEENMRDLEHCWGRRRQEQIRQLKGAASAVARLQGTEIMKRHFDELNVLTEGFRTFRALKWGKPPDPVLDPEFGRALIRDMRAWHPLLIEKAHNFGVSGGFARYSQQLRTQ